MKSGREVDSASFVLGAVEDRAAPGCLHLQTDDGTNRDIRCTLMPPRKLQNRTTSHDVTVSTIGKRGGERNICALHDRNAPPGGVGPDELSVLTRFTSDCVSPGILTSSCSWNSDSSSSRTLASCILFFFGQRRWSKSNSKLLYSHVLAQQRGLAAPDRDENMDEPSPREQEQLPGPVSGVENIFPEYRFVSPPQDLGQ